MNNNESGTGKAVLAIIVIIVVFFIWENSHGTTDKQNTYTMELNEPYTLCGKTFYISNDSENNQLYATSIIENAEELCNYRGMENTKDEIKNLLDDDSYTKEEILSHLQDIYYSYLDE